MPSGKLAPSGRVLFASGSPRGSGAAVASAFRCPAPEPTRLDERQAGMGDAIARSEQLRDRFALARKRLEALPATGLSDDGQPYIREIVEALQSFAAWYGELTLDDLPLHGSAYRVCDTVNGLDAIADWVGLHRSQQFAADIREHVRELVEQSEALDKAVSAAFTVKRTASELVQSRNRQIPQAKRDAIDDGIQEVASLAGHLAVRLQRVAAMVPPLPALAAAKQQKRRDRKGIGGRPERYTLKFIREVFAARERDQKHAAKASHPLPRLPEWLSDYFTMKKLPLSTLPSKDPQKPEEWNIRARRFWKAAKKRLREAETNRH